MTVANRAHALYIPLKVATGKRGWRKAAVCFGIQLVILKSRVDVGVYAMVLTLVTVLACVEKRPRYYWPGVGPETYGEMRPALRRYMKLFVLGGFGLPLLVARKSTRATSHVVGLILQILFERIVVSLELNVAAAYSVPIILTAYRVWTSVSWCRGASLVFETTIACSNVGLWLFNLVYTLGLSNVAVLLLTSDDDDTRSRKD